MWGVEEAVVNVVHVQSQVVASLAGVFGGRSARALPAAALLGSMTVLPALAGSGPTSLDSPDASPTTGTPATTIVLAVSYRNAEGSSPDYVRVSIAGSVLAMTADSNAETWKHGVRFTVQTTLPVGTWTPRFEACDRERFTVSVTGPVITISPPPTPTPRAHPGAHSHARAHASSDRNPGPDRHAAVDPHSHARAHSSSDRNPGPDRHAAVDPHSHARAHSSSDRNPGPDRHAAVDPHSHARAHSSSDRNPGPDRHAAVDPHSHARAHSSSDRNPGPDRHAAVGHGVGRR